MADFFKTWKNETKQIATKNTVNENTISLLQKGKNYKYTKEELKCIENCKSTFRDINGMIYISNTIKIVDLYLATHKISSAYFAANELYQILSSENYWSNVFRNDYASKEAKSRLELKNSLKKLLNKTDE